MVKYRYLLGLKRGRLEESAFFLLLHGIFFIWCWTALGGSWLFDSENGKKQYKTIVEVQCFISKARQNINESNQRIVKS